MTWSKTDEYPFNPLEGDCTQNGLEEAKSQALEAMNAFLKPEMRFAKALEDWEEETEVKQPAAL